MLISALRYIAILFICIFSASCTNTQQAKPGRAYASFSMVSTSDTNIHFNKGASFSWQPQSRSVFGDTRINKTELNQILDQSFKEALIKQGYLWKGTSSAAQYNITYIAIAGDAVSDADINSVFKVNPGMGSASHKDSAFEQGTLIVNIVDSRSGQSVWQVAMQANLHKDDGLDVRKQRINRVVYTIVSKMP